MEEEKTIKIKKINNKFSNLSLDITKKISNDIKKKNGIYFTPPTIIRKIIKILKKNNHFDNINTILEPSCGSCEIINILNSNIKNKKITGIEFNDIIYDNIKNINFTNNNDINIINGDYLKYNENYEILYDLIIGNPPYYVLKKNLVDISGKVVKIK